MITITIDKSILLVTIDKPEQVHAEFTINEIDTFINMLQCIFNNFNFVDGDMVKLEVLEK